MIKKIAIILLLFTTTIFAFDPFDEENEADKLVIRICDFILDHEKEMKRKGFGIQELFWSSINRIYKNSVASYQIDLIKGKTYIFYTLTTGEPVSVMIKKDDDENIKKEYFCPSDKIIMLYTVPENGSYHYIVKSASIKRGLHKSHFSVFIDMEQ